MDIEQLKLIIELVKGTTDSAVWLAVLYFFLPLVKILLYFIGWSIMLPILIRGGKEIISLTSGEDVKQIRTLLGVGARGYLSSDEVREILRILKNKQ